MITPNTYICFYSHLPISIDKSKALNTFQLFVMSNNFNSISRCTSPSSDSYTKLILSKKVSLELTLSNTHVSEHTPYKTMAMFSEGNPSNVLFS